MLCFFVILQYKKLFLQEKNGENSLCNGLKGKLEIIPPNFIVNQHCAS